MKTETETETHLVLKRKLFHAGAAWKVDKVYETEMDALDYVRGVTRNDDYETDSGPCEGAHGMEYCYLHGHERDFE